MKCSGRLSNRVSNIIRRCIYRPHECCCLYGFFVYRIPSRSFGPFYDCIYDCMRCTLLFNFVTHVFYCYVHVFLCMFCSLYSVFFVPTGTLRLPRLRFFRVRQMPGYKRKDGARPALFPISLTTLGSNPRKPSNQSC